MVDENNGSSDKNKKIAVIAGMITLIVVVVLILLWVFSPDPTDAPSDTPPGLPEETLPEPEPEPIPVPAEQEPEEEPPEELEEPQPEAEPLPPLGQSDNAIREEIEEVSPQLTDVLTRENVILKSVRAITAMEGGTLVHQYRPVTEPASDFVAEPVDQRREDDDLQQYRLTEENYRRYDNYVSMLTNLDTFEVRQMYERWYPLLEQAYQQQGETQGRFHDVAIAAIDQLLQAPIIDGEILLVNPSVMFRYSDPRLERLPGAQKLMIRIGPENSRKVKSFLRDLRVELESYVPEQ